MKRCVCCGEDLPENPAYCSEYCERTAKPSQQADALADSMRRTAEAKARFEASFKKGPP